MRYLLIAFLAASCLAQQTQRSRTTENLRGVSAVSRQVAWASGSHGTYLRTTDGGDHWTAAQVLGATSLDFRGVSAFSADEAFLMSAGPGEQSRIYHTTDAGKHWEQQFTNSNPKGFFDSMTFWDNAHGVVLGDPIPDESGKLKFDLLITDDGRTWRQLPTAQLPAAEEGEGAFAASNACIAIKDSSIWFATGGRIARVFHSPDRGHTWEVANTPILHGLDSTGIFSITFHDARHGVIAGGDYKRPSQDGPNLAFTSDGGKTWTVSLLYPQLYFSAVAFDRKDTNHVYIVGPDFIFDFIAPQNPKRISPPRKSGFGFNAVSPYPEGGALFVGPKGTIVTLH